MPQDSTRLERIAREFIAAMCDGNDYWDSFADDTKRLQLRQAEVVVGMIDAACAAEREECAKVADGIEVDDLAMLRSAIVDGIRARGSK